MYIYNINGFKKFHFRKVGYKKKAETSAKFSVTKLFYKKVIKYIFKQYNIFDSKVFYMLFLIKIQKQMTRLVTNFGMAN